MNQQLSTRILTSCPSKHDEQHWVEEAERHGQDVLMKHR